MINAGTILSPAFLTLPVILYNLSTVVLWGRSNKFHLKKSILFADIRSGFWSIWYGNVESINRYLAAVRPTNLALLSVAGRAFWGTCSDTANFAMKTSIPLCFWESAWFRGSALLWALQSGIIYVRAFNIVGSHRRSQIVSALVISRYDTPNTSSPHSDTHSYWVWWYEK